MELAFVPVFTSMVQVPPVSLEIVSVFRVLVESWSFVCLMSSHVVWLYLLSLVVFVNMSCCAAASLNHVMNK